jgi:hypothetical protein
VQSAAPDMNATLLLASVLAAVVTGIFVYTAIRWRRSPRVFKAMNYVALLSLIVGIAIGAVAMRAIVRLETAATAHRTSQPPVASQPAGTSQPAGAVGGRSPEGESAAGIPVGDVSKALVGTQLRHLMDGKAQSWSAVAQDCRLGLTDPHSLRCEAAFIYDDPHGVRGEWKDHTEKVPYAVVMKFCDAGWAEKDSKVCTAASHSGSKPG